MSTTQDSFAAKYGDFAYCRMTVVKQADSKSCGTASLTAVLNHWDVEATEQQLLEEFAPPTKAGFSAAQLVTIARAKDLQAYAFSMNPQPLEKLTEQIHKGRPIICMVKMPQALYLGYDLPLFGHVYRGLSWAIGPRTSHFIVVFGTKDDKFLIMDPAFGFSTLPAARLADAWARHENLAILCARAAQTPNLSPESYTTASPTKEESSNSAAKPAHPQQRPTP